MERNKENVLQNDLSCNPRTNAPQRREYISLFTQTSKVLTEWYSTVLSSPPLYNKLIEVDY